MNGTDARSEFAPSTIAELNRRAVLDTLEAVGTPCSISALVRLTTLSRPTVSAAIAALIGAGTVVMDEPSGSTPRGGRPGRRYRVATDSRLVISGVVGPHGIHGQLADLDGSVLVERYVAVEMASSDTETVLTAVTALLHDLHHAGSVGSGVLACLSISVLGVVRNRRTIILSHTLPMLQGEVLYERLAAEFPVPVIIENDANCAALAEAAERPSVSTMIGLLAGEVLGCGIVLDGKLHRGAHGAAGELSSRRWTELLALLQSPGDAAQILRIFTSAGNGETAAVSFASDVGTRVAQLLAPAIEFLDPDVVVVGGEAAAAGEALMVPFREELELLLGWAPDVDVTALADRTVITGVHLLGSRRARSALMESGR